MKKYLIGVYVLLMPLLSMGQLPETQTINQVNFIEGGVGLDESDAVKSELKNWPVLLQFSKRNGNKSEWVSDVSIVVTDASGNEVLSHQVDGPMILLGLKPGKYSIESILDSQKIVTNLYVVNGQHRTFNISWK